MNRASEVGLKNANNTCYVNAVLQALKHTPAVAAFFCDDICQSHKTCKEKKSDECIVCALKNCFRMIGQSTNAFKPEMILQKMGGILTDYVRGRQEDAHELITRVIGIVHDTLATTSYALDFRGIFQSTIATIVKCQLCKTTSVRDENFYELTLEVRPTIKDSLKRFFEEESVIGHHCDTCSTTGGPTTIRSRLKEGPQVLLLRLTREATGAKKTFVEVPERLSLHTHTNTPREKPSVYSLTATVNHIGDSINYGHYTATTRTKAGGFRLFDDDIVSSTSLAAAGTKVYLVLYEKEKTAKESAVSLESQRQDSSMIVETSDDVEMQTVEKIIEEPLVPESCDPLEDSRFSGVTMRKRRKVRSPTLSPPGSSPNERSSSLSALTAESLLQSPQAIQAQPPLPSTSVTDRSTVLKKQTVVQTTEDPSITECGDNENASAPRKRNRVMTEKRQKVICPTLSPPDTSLNQKSFSSRTMPAESTQVIRTPTSSSPFKTSSRFLDLLHRKQTMNRISEEPSMAECANDDDTSGRLDLSKVTIRKRHKARRPLISALETTPGSENQMDSSNFIQGQEVIRTLGRDSLTPPQTTSTTVQASSTTVQRTSSTVQATLSTGPGRLPLCSFSPISPKATKGPKDKGGRGERGRGVGVSTQRTRKTTTALQRQRRKVENEYRARVLKQSRALQKNSGCDFFEDIARDYRGCMHRILEKHLIGR